MIFLSSQMTYTDDSSINSLFSGVICLFSFPLLYKKQQVRQQMVIVDPGSHDWDTSKKDCLTASTGELAN